MKIKIILASLLVTEWMIVQGKIMERFPLKIILKKRDVTKMYLSCKKYSTEGSNGEEGVKSGQDDYQICLLDFFQPKEHSNLTIVLDEQGNQELRLKRVILADVKTTSFNQLDHFKIDLEGVEVDFKHCTIGSRFLEIKASKVDISFSLFEYKKVIVESREEIVLKNSNFIPAYNEYCSDEITKSVFDRVFEGEGGRGNGGKFDQKDCDLWDVEAQKAVSGHIRWVEGSKEEVEEDRSYVVLISDTIRLGYSTTLKANAIIISRVLELSNSIITSSESGCSKDKLPGSPKLFVSHSFKCELNAGSHGGRGGVGLAESTENSDECIKNAYSRMTTFGDAFRPMAGGATGGNYLATRSSEEIAPGAIAIVTNQLTMDDLSKVISGYDSVLEIGAPSSSGGSIFISGKSFDVNGTIHANGQSSNQTTFGEGAGGRVFVRNLCWFQEDSFQFGMEAKIEAKKGLRKGIEEMVESRISGWKRKESNQKDYMVKLISAEDGTVKSSPCLQGYEGVPCRKCNEGWIKVDYLDEKCHRCMNPNSGTLFRYNGSPFNCHDNVCDDKVKIIIDINQHCLLTENLVNFYFIEYHQIFVKYFFAVLAMICLLDIMRWVVVGPGKRGLDRPIRMTKLEKIFEEKIPVNLNKKVTLSFQGLNSPGSPWFLEFEICKEFNPSFMYKGEVLALRREINRISKWPKKRRIMLSIIQYLFPFLKKRYKFNTRKRIFMKILNYLRILNLTNKRKHRSGGRKAYNYILWADSTFSIAQVTIVHLGLKETIRRPFNILIKGNCTARHHLRLAFNPVCIKQDLLLQFPNLKNSEIDSKTQFLREKILSINYILRQISADDNPMYFYYKMVNLLKQIDLLNEKVLRAYKLICRLVLVEHLVYKLESLNYQYNKLVLVNSKSMDRLELLRKYIQSVNSCKNFEPQFSLMFLPGGNSAYLELTSMMNKKKNSSSIFNLPFKSDLHIKEGPKAKMPIKSNRIDLKNLNTNLESLREFKKIKKKTTISSFFTSNTKWFNRLNQRPINISLSTREIYVTRVYLLLLFALDWILLLLYTGLTVFHIDYTARIFLLASLFLPNFLPFLYSFFCQFSWIFAFKFKFLKFLGKMNSSSIVNLVMLFPGYAFYFLVVSSSKEYVMIAVPCLVVFIKLSQNYLIRCLDGSIMNGFISVFNSQLKVCDEDCEDSSDGG